MRSKLCRVHFVKQAVRKGKKSVGNAGNAKGNPGNAGNADAKGNPGNAGNAEAKGNPKNAGNTSTGQGSIKAGKRSGLRRRAKNMQTMKAMAVSMKKTTKTMQATKTARRANSYAEGVAKLPRTIMKAMKAMKTMKCVPVRARRELDEWGKAVRAAYQVLFPRDGRVQLLSARDEQEICKKAKKIYKTSGASGNTARMGFGIRSIG